MPVTAIGPVTLRNIRYCARCGGDHQGPLIAAPLTQPFAPEEARGVVWSHWLACPTNGEPILVRQEVTVNHVGLTPDGLELSTSTTTEQG